MVLYPYIEGVDGYARALSEQEWVTLGATGQAHPHSRLDTGPQEWNVPRESYSPLWRERVKAFQLQLDDDPPAEPLAAELAHILRSACPPRSMNWWWALMKWPSIAGPTRQTWFSADGDLHAGNLLLGQTARSTSWTGRRPSWC